MRALASVALLACCAAPAGAHEVDLSINSDAFRGTYATDAGDRLRLDGGWLHNSDSGDLVHAGLMVTGDATPGPEPVKAGLGGRLAYLDGDGNGRNGYALGVGGSFRWVLPQWDRVALSGELYYAPDVLTGGDADNYTDVSGRVGYSVTHEAEVYVGARYVKGEFDNRPNVYFDTGMDIGLNLRF